MSESDSIPTRIRNAAARVWYHEWDYDPDIPISQQTLDTAQMWSDALGMLDVHEMKVTICEYMLGVNRGFVEESGYPFIAPTAIDWLGNGIVSAIVSAGKTKQAG
jgi:hypothetical protein